MAKLIGLIAVAALASSIVPTVSTADAIGSAQITPIDTAIEGASAALVNLTMVDGRAPGYITADHCASLISGPQSKSHGNHPTGSAVSNLAVVPVDDAGRFCMFNQVDVDLIVDVQGYFGVPALGGFDFLPSAGARLLDT